MSRRVMLLALGQRRSLSNRPHSACSRQSRPLAWPKDQYARWKNSSSSL